MAGAALELTLTGLAERFEQKADELSRMSFRKPLGDCKLLLVSETRRNFDEGHSPDGVAWLPLRNPSAKRGGPSAKPLRDRDLLMASVTAGGAGHVEEITDYSLVWGSNLAYAAVHQYGRTVNRPERSRRKPWVFLVEGRKVFTRRIRAHQQTIPARPFLGFNERLETKFRLVFGEYLAERLSA